MVFLAGEQDIYCGMCTLEFSSTLMHADSNSPLFFYIRHVFSYTFVCHVGSGFTQLLLIIWQRARWLFLKETWKLSRRGKKGSCDLHKYFNLRKTQYLWVKLSVVCVGCGLFLFFFSFNDQGYLFVCLFVYIAQITDVCLYR
jgi:hypothetical protein